MERMEEYMEGTENKAKRYVMGIDTEKEEAYSFVELEKIVAALRSENGCPWDKSQTYESMKKCLADETEEVFQAIDNQDMDNLCEELGDVLLQVMLNSQIARERGDFTIDDVIDGLCRKMIRRHPHVFGELEAITPEEGLKLWNQIKAREKAEKSRPFLKEFPEYP